MKLPLFYLKQGQARKPLLSIGAADPNSPLGQLQDTADILEAQGAAADDIFPQLNSGILRSFADRLEKGGILTPQEATQARQLILSVGKMPNGFGPVTSADLTNNPYTPTGTVNLPPLPGTTAASPGTPGGFVTQTPAPTTSPLTKVLLTFAVTAPVWGTWFLLRRHAIGRR